MLYQMDIIPYSTKWISYLWCGLRFRSADPSWFRIQASCSTKWISSYLWCGFGSRVTKPLDSGFKHRTLPSVYHTFDVDSDPDPQTPFDHKIKHHTLPSGYHHTFDVDSDLDPQTPLIPDPSIILYQVDIITLMWIQIQIHRPTWFRIQASYSTKWISYLWCGFGSRSADPNDSGSKYHTLPSDIITVPLMNLLE